MFNSRYLSNQPLTSKVKNKVKINRSFNLNYHNFHKLNQNVRPATSNYLFLRMNRKDINMKEKLQD